jgi:hypothetical protein
MAERRIQICDLTKREYDPSETVTLTIKRKGKTKGRTYDLCPEAADQLEQHLVSEAGTFTIFDKLPPEDPEVQDPPLVLDDLPEAANVDQEKLDDAAFVAEKKRELADRLEQNAAEDQKPGPKPSEGCTHINRTRVKMTIRNGESYAYTNCCDCGGELPVRKKQDRESYMAARPPKGTREGLNVKE